jgi:hypothetical protein
VREQTSSQQHKAADQLHSLADEIHEMAAKGGQSSMATEVARQASERIHGAASWLEHREPGDLFDEVRNFARRRPGAFLAGAVVAGVVAGRLTRGATATAQSSSAPSEPAKHAHDPVAPERGAPAAEPVGTPTLPGYGGAGVSGRASAQASGGAGASEYPSSRPGQP